MALVRAAIPGWKLHPIGIPGNPDLVFPQNSLVIFVDGCFWHGCPKCGHIPHTNSKFWTAKFERNKERDRLNDKAIRKAGMKVIRVWEHSLANAGSRQRVIEKIKRDLSWEARRS
jgi:DNA mismatch endonuclease (patch repair protein)